MGKVKGGVISSMRSRSGKCYATLFFCFLILDSGVFTIDTVKMKVAQVQSKDWHA